MSFSDACAAQLAETSILFPLCFAQAGQSFGCRPVELLHFGGKPFMRIFYSNMSFGAVYIRMSRSEYFLYLCAIASGSHVSPVYPAPSLYCV